MNKPLYMALLCLHGLLPIALIGLQGDYGTAIVFVFIFVCMIVSADISWKYLAAAPFILAAVLFLAWNFVLGYDHKRRIEVLLHPGTDPEGLEYQQNLGLAALNNGKVLGIGLFNKEEKYISVPEIHNDFILAYAGQVFGFVGAIGLIAILAYKIGLKKSNKHFTFGFKRAEIIGAFVNLILLFISAFYLFAEGLSRIISPQDINGELIIYISFKSKYFN